MTTTTFDAFHAAIVAAGCFCWTDGTEHVARCPSHQDDNPSMGYRQGTNGAAVVAHCFAGCDFRDMVDALALPAGPTPVLYREAPPTRRRNGHGPSRRGAPLAQYEYCDANGLPVHRTVRWGKDHRPPFTQEHYAEGRWRPGLDGIRPLLYRLPELLAAPRTSLVIWPEGEKDVETLRAAGLLATTNPMGADNWNKVDLAPLADRPLAIIGDNDVPGRRAAQLRAHAALSLAAEVRCLPSLPDVPEHGDVTDFLALHGGPDLLLTLLAATPPIVPTPTSWDSLDLDPVLAGKTIDPPPTMLARTDGLCLLYPGKIHAFNGEPESGKGWLAMFACAERIVAGEHVLYIDFEDVAATAVARLLSLGVDPSLLLTYFHYIRPDEPLAGQAIVSIEHALRRYAPTLCIVDGVTEALTLHGWDINDNNDQAKYLAAIPRRLARRGAAVANIDHVVKSRDGRGRYAIGAQHKLAGIDVAYTVDVTKPLGRGLDGQLRLDVAKDRPGFVRGASGFGKHAADLLLSATADGTCVTIELRPPAASAPDGRFRPTHLMEQLSLFLEASPEPLSTNTLLDGIAGKRDHRRRALATLIAEGYIAVESGPNRAKFHRLVRPFREESSPVGPWAPGGPPVGPEHANSGGTGWAPPLKGGAPGAHLKEPPESPPGGTPDDDLW